VYLHGHVGVWYVTHNAAVQYNKINCSSLYYMYVLQKFIVCSTSVDNLECTCRVIAILGQYLVASLCYTHGKGIIYVHVYMWIGTFLLLYFF
jgi:hypothetical protein